MRLRAVRPVLHCFGWTNLFWCVHRFRGNVASRRECVTEIQLMLSCCFSEIQVAVQHNNRLFSKSSTFSGKQYNFDQVNGFYISQGSAVDSFSRCGGQMHNHLCQISSLFCVLPSNQTLLKLVHFWLSYSRNTKMAFFGPQLNYSWIRLYGRIRFDESWLRFSDSLANRMVWLRGCCQKWRHCYSFTFVYWCHFRFR